MVIKNLQNKKIKKFKKINIEKVLSKMPKDRPLSNKDIWKFTKNLPYFRHICMRDQFKNIRCRPIEAGIANMQNSNQNGSHWCAYWRKNNNVFYYDSFGGLIPPTEMIEYFGESCNIFYNRKPNQTYDTFICGQLAVIFLYVMFNNWNKM